MTHRSSIGLSPPGRGEAEASSARLIDHAELEADSRERLGDGDLKESESTSESQSEPNGELGDAMAGEFLEVVPPRSKGSRSR